MPATFYGARPQNTIIPGETVVHGPRPLIMPLLFSPDEMASYLGDQRPFSDEMVETHGEGAELETKGAKSQDRFYKRKHAQDLGVLLGHFILAIARKTNDDIIQISIMNSSVKHIAKAAVSKTVRSLVTNKGWLGIDQGGVQNLPRTVFLTF